MLFHLWTYSWTLGAFSQKVKSPILCISLDRTPATLVNATCLCGGFYCVTWWFASWAKTHLKSSLIASSEMERLKRLCAEVLRRIWDGNSNTDGNTLICVLQEFCHFWNYDLPTEWIIWHNISTKCPLCPYRYNSPSKILLLTFSHYIPRCMPIFEEVHPFMHSFLMQVRVK